MAMYIQDPEDNSTAQLLDALLEACVNAEAGAGAYAFATRGGLELLLDDSDFVDFCTRGSFELIVGVDAITDVRAIRKLQDQTAAIPNLTANVLLTPNGGPIFHPKMSWFRNGKQGVVISGSGNLTDGGLRSNWEAFVVEQLDARGIASVEQTWATFKAVNPGRFVELDHPEVQKRAAINARRPANLGSNGGTKSPYPPIGLSVLVAEIPDNNARFTQANFHKNTFTSYFGAQPGVQQRVVFHQVGKRGAVQDREARPSVSSRSKNFRFELGALSGHAYPAHGRPIGVYMRIAARTFLYCVFFPQDAEYPMVSGFLAARAKKKGNQMLECFCTTGDLRAGWPTAPFWQVDLSKI